MAKEISFALIISQLKTVDAIVDRRRSKKWKRRREQGKESVTQVHTEMYNITLQVRKKCDLLWELLDAFD